ncbi:MAG TPA: GrpB family protein [Armatimonadota bacterium]|nr:GrpB family protein [Armatimonadota bacterium]
MIGLKRHTVRIVDYDPAWAARYREEARVIRSALDALAVDVQHVGSTAVPGLMAKPILDIAVAVEALEAIPEVVRRLVATGYIDRGDAGRNGGYLLARESEPEVRVVHTHLVCRDDDQWRNYLAFRDLLRGDPEIRAGYARLKRELAARFPNDRRNYTAGKEAFVRSALIQALSKG